MAQSIFELSTEQLAAVERALLEIMYRQGWIVPSGSDPEASPMFRISIPEYMEHHYQPKEHWEACQGYLKEEERDALRVRQGIPWRGEEEGGTLRGGRDAFSPTEPD